MGDVTASQSKITTNKYIQESTTTHILLEIKEPIQYLKKVKLTYIDLQKVLRLNHVPSPLRSCL